MGLLRIGCWPTEVDESLLRLASVCSRLERFRASASAQARLRVSRCSARAGEEWIPLDGTGPAPGAYAIHGAELLISIPDEPASAEAALRAVFLVATLRQGGILMHASAVVFDGRAVVATGASGAGKSTLARLCVAAGAGLLSDETVALHPDGAVFGTPFFSDEDLVGDVEQAELGAILTLVKGDHEELAEIEASLGTAQILAQTYRPPPAEGPGSVLLAAAARLALQPGLRRLTFRKDEASGRFVQRWIVGESGRAERR